MTAANSDELVLRWHRQEATLLGNIQYYLDADVLTDVTLSVDATYSVRAHRLVLAMCSGYFLQLFQEMGDSMRPAVVVLHNVSVVDVKAILAFIYRGQCVVTSGQLPRLLAVARSLKIQGLCDMKVPDTIYEPLPSYQPHLYPHHHHHQQQQQQQQQRQQQKFVASTNTTVNYTKNPKNETETAVACSAGCDDKNESCDLTTPPPPPLLPTQPTRNTNDSSNTSLKNNCTSSTPPEKQQATAEVTSCKCFLCGKYLSNQYNLRVHMETHEEAYHACASCPHVSRSRDALRKHVSYRHPNVYQHTRKKKRTAQT